VSASAAESGDRDLIRAAEVVSPFLHISPSARDEANATIGPECAAIVIASILQRGAVIKKPGGYFRFLTRRVASGKLDLSRMLMTMAAKEARWRKREEGAYWLSFRPLAEDGRADPDDRTDDDR
jgi:hypothetical protein